MFTCSSRTAVALCLLVSTVAAETPQLGEPLSAEELENLDVTVLPDGEGLPAGSGSVQEGEALYRQHCLACHGEDAVGGINGSLAGGHGSLTSERPVKTVGSFWPYATTLFDYVRRAMPYQEPGTLSSDEVYALAAYLLHINGIVAADARLDAASLVDVRMPNRDDIVWVYEPASAPSRQK